LTVIFCCHKIPPLHTYQKDFIQQKIRLSSSRQAFRLTDHPRIAPSLQAKARKWPSAVLVPDHGNGWHAMESHHLSFYPESALQNDSGTLTIQPDLYK